MSDLRMPDLNKVYLAGRLTRDPELRYTPSGLALCTMGLAVSRRYKTKDGEQREDTLYINLTVWDKFAEYCGANYKKGRPILVEGQLRMDSWEDKQTGQKRTSIEVQADRIQALDWEDRSTCVLFGDGAGAVLVGAQATSGTAEDRGVLATCLHSDGAYNDILYVDGGPSWTGAAGKVRMQGREVFKHAVAKLADVSHEVMAKAGVVADDIDWVVPHQANIRIIEATAKKAGVPMEKVILTLQDHGNTSAASIPLALSTAVGDGRIRPGDLLLMEAIGGGLVWGGALLRW